MSYLKIVFFFFILNSFGQNLEYLKNQDTIYVYFNNGDFQNKFIYNGNVKKTEFNKNTIFYEFKKEIYDEIYFYYQKYKDFDHYDLKIETEVKQVKRKFLRKNKSLIIDIDFFLKNGFKEVFFKVLYGKVVYIIDKDEFRKGKITLREVQVTTNYIEE